MALYDIDGNEIGSGSLTPEQIQNAFVEAVADGTISFPAQIGATRQCNAPQALQTNCTAAYQQMLAYYKTCPNSGVPFFVSTDQHGAGLELPILINNIDQDGVEITNINLGDTVVDYYIDGVLEDYVQKVKYLKNYVGVVGNHDYKEGDDVSYYTINNCFKTTYPVYKKIADPHDCYTVYDGAHMVKYICVDHYDLGTGNPGWGYQTSVANWLIDELTVNDGYDCILLIHWPSFLTMKTRSMSEESAVQGSTAAENATNAQKVALWNMFVARKRKTSGTFTDAENVVHTYDFSNCENELLCEISGHEHIEAWSVKDGLLNYVCDGALYGNYTCGIIDRDNNKAVIWHFNSTAVSDVLEIPL